MVRLPAEDAARFVLRGSAKPWFYFLSDIGLRHNLFSSRPTQSSWLTLLMGFTLIDAKGNEYGNYALKRYGYWGWERLGEQLPYDYQPGS